MVLFPKYVIKEYQNKIVNIHPALLPKYGGKGMYGINVHQAVFDAGEKTSGITIHYVNHRPQWWLKRVISMCVYVHSLQNIK